MVDEGGAISQEGARRLIELEQYIPRGLLELIRSKPYLAKFCLLNPDLIDFIMDLEIHGKLQNSVWEKAVEHVMKKEDSKAFSQFREEFKLAVQLSEETYRVLEEERERELKREKEEIERLL